MRSQWLILWWKYKLLFSCMPCSKTSHDVHSAITLQNFSSYFIGVHFIELNSLPTLETSNIQYSNTQKNQLFSIDLTNVVPYGIENPVLKLSTAWAMNYMYVCFIETKQLHLVRYFQYFFYILRLDSNIQPCTPCT